MRAIAIRRPMRPLAAALGPLLAAGLLATAEPATAAVGRSRVGGCEGGGQCWPAAFAFTPNGRKIFYGERFTGEIRVLNLRTDNDRRWHRIPGVDGTAGETGLLGLALDPRWPRAPWVYVYFTKDGSPDRNLIMRFRKRDGGGVRKQRLMSLGANSNHNGGVIQFGPDGKLYAVTGDLGNPARAQRRADPAGKVLRMTKTGNRPAGNPFNRGKAWSYGHRNSFGFAFDPRTGRLWQTENGPTCTDEINHILKGRNYGWGRNSECPNTSTEGPNPKRPERSFSPPPALTGAAFCQRCGLGRRNNGKLLFGDWNNGWIRRARLDRDRNDIVGVRRIFDNPAGVLGMVAAPNGRVFFSDPSGIYRLRR